MRIKLVFYNILLSIFTLYAFGQDSLIFGITPNDPMVYCQIGDEFSGLDLIKDDIFEKVRGYDIDLLKFLAYKNNWDLSTWKVVCLDYDTLLQKIKQKEIIMGLGGIPITALRLSEGYEFSLPVYSSGLKIVSKTYSAPEIWSFFDSFEPSLWIVILCTTLFTGLVTWILEDQTFQWKKNPQRCQTNLKEMIWQTFSGLFYTSEIRLQKFPARIVWLCFWFMILILTATYTADLTTKMAGKSQKLVFKSLENAASIGAKIATLDPYKKTVASYGINNLVVKPWNATSLTEIEDMFLNEIDGVIIDAPAAYKINSKFPCSSYIFSESLISFNYGFIFWNDVNNTFVQNVDSALLEVKESREFQSLLKQNIYVAPEDEACGESIQKLTFSRLGGLFIIFFGAVVIAICIDQLDAYWSRKKGTKRKVNKKVAEMNADEKKFVLDSYLMISDYIHIPSSDLHLKLEDDIKNALENVEQTLKDRFNSIEKKILDILNTNSKALGILDASTSEIQSQAENIPHIEGKLKLD